MRPPMRELAGASGEQMLNRPLGPGGNSAWPRPWGTRGMQVLTFEEIVARLTSLGGSEPRIVVSGNSATPGVLMRALTAALERGRIFAINSQHNWSDHPGLISETPFVGTVMRHDPMLEYIPMRLSLVPRLFATACPVDLVLIHTSVPSNGRVSLGIEVNVLPAAIEQAGRAKGLWSPN